MTNGKHGRKKDAQRKKGGFFDRFWPAQIFYLYYTKFVTYLVGESNPPHRSGNPYISERPKKSIL